MRVVQFTCQVGVLGLQSQVLPEVLFRALLEEGDAVLLTILLDQRAVEAFDKFVVVLNTGEAAAMITYHILPASKTHLLVCKPSNIHMNIFLLLYCLLPQLKLL